MSTILVGPTGFLGESFLRLNPNIISVGRKEPVNPSIQHIKINSDFDFSPLDELNVDNAIFLIGSSDHKILNQHPTIAFEKNVLPLSRFLHYMSTRKKPPHKILTFTTMLQYDSEKMKLPCDETQPIKAHINNYVLSKVTAEQISKMYRKFFEIIDIRLSNVYGPTHLRRPDLIPSLIHSILDKSTTKVWTKKPLRDFVFVDDVVNIVMKLLKTDYSGPINVGSGKSESVKNICDILEKLCGVKIFSEEREVSGHMEYYHDLSLLNSLVKFCPTPINKGLKKTYDYMYSIEREENPTMLGS